MKKRISFILAVLILVSAFMISASADFNTFTFLTNLQFSEQTNYPIGVTYRSTLTSSDELLLRYSVGMNTYNYTFLGYLLYLRDFVKAAGDSSSYAEINIPIRANLPQGASIQIPILLCGNADQSLSNIFKGSYCTLGGTPIPFELTTNGTSSSTLSYINNVYYHYLDVTVPGSSQDHNYQRSQLIMVNIFNNRDTDMYCAGFTLRYNRTITAPEYIIFPMIYEGDDLVFYYPPNPYNIPILKDIIATLDHIISKLVSGDNSVADLLDTVISMIESLDISIGSIDTNIIQIVDQLNYLASIDASNSAINSTLIDIRRTLHDLAVGSQYSPSDAFTQDINNNQQYINTEQATTVNRYNYANENKNDIYTSSSSGLNASGGTYDFVSDLVADAGSDQGFNGIFGLIFGDNNISGIILTVIALGTISYILYGKRG